METRRLNQRHPLPGAVSSDINIVVNHETVSQLVDITHVFNPSAFESLHTLPPDSIQLHIFKMFMEEAYLFKYDALKNKYQPMYVLCLFPDHLNSEDNFDWAMTVFKLPDGKEQAYGCECVPIDDLWKVNSQIIIDCYQRAFTNKFFFFLRLTDTKENRENVGPEDGEVFESDDENADIENQPEEVQAQPLGDLTTAHINRR